MRIRQERLTASCCQEARPDRKVLLCRFSSSNLLVIRPYHVSASHCLQLYV
jgi:hypothetical protein